MVFSRVGLLLAAVLLALACMILHISNKICFVLRARLLLLLLPSILFIHCLGSLCFAFSYFVDRLAHKRAERAASFRSRAKRRS